LFDTGVVDVGDSTTDPPGPAAFGFASPGPPAAAGVARLPADGVTDPAPGAGEDVCTSLEAGAVGEVVPAAGAGVAAEDEGGVAGAA
jgi:hypothetical protein